MTHDMNRKELPVGLQTFHTIRKEQGEYYYVDKTDYAYQLARKAGHFFLSRPRRFGKSLFVDTLKNLFEGNQELFEGLAVHDKWDWDVKYPVVHFKFGGGNFNQPGELNSAVMGKLARMEQCEYLTPGGETASERLTDLIERLAAKKGQRVVILVDEYDKPILDALSTPELAKANRDYLAGFYGTIKDCEANIRFSFLTGVSKFAKAGIFSGLNNLRDITLEPEFSSICGYTDHDIDTVFAPELDVIHPDFGKLDREKIKECALPTDVTGRQSGTDARARTPVAGVHNSGRHRSDRSCRVWVVVTWPIRQTAPGSGLPRFRTTHPFSILQLFRKREFKSWWFETGTPKFLVDTLEQNDSNIADIEGTVIGDEAMSSFDIGRIDTATLLFQTGYLTIEEEMPTARGSSYRLECPNLEVRMSLHGTLLQHLAPVSAAEHEKRLNTLEHCIKAGDFDGVMELLQALCATISYYWYTWGGLAKYESHFATMVCSAFFGAGLDTRTEEAASGGRVDMAIVTDAHVVLFEFKVLKRGCLIKGRARPTPSGGGLHYRCDAMRQLLKKDYAARYRGFGLPIYLVGMEFSPMRRKIASYQVAEA